MAVDRSLYREIYPDVLKLTNKEAELFASNIHPTPKEFNGQKKMI